MSRQMPYRTYSSYLKQTFHGPTRKLSLHANMSCPNRDGKVSREGCIFCEPQSFSPHCHENAPTVLKQIRLGIEQGQKRGIHRFVAYFQSFTNTYAPVNVLQGTYDVIRAFPEIKGLAIGTRPDCIDSDIMKLIDSYSSEYDVWLELGLQSIHDQTLKTINRGHDSKSFFDAVQLIRNYNNIKICAHIILGLPDETEIMEQQTAQALAQLKIEGVKIHPLYVIANTKLATIVAEHNYVPLEKDTYIKRVVSFLEYLWPETVVQRLTADCPDGELVAPQWLADKGLILERIQTAMYQTQTFQGRLYVK